MSQEVRNRAGAPTQESGIREGAFYLLWAFKNHSGRAHQKRLLWLSLGRGISNWKWLDEKVFTCHSVDFFWNILTCITKKISTVVI